MASGFTPSPFCNESASEKLHEIATFAAVFSRVYNGKNLECKHISGVMAQRLYCHLQVFHDEIPGKSSIFENSHLGSFFRDWKNPSHVYIPKSYINFMCKSDTFKTYMKYATVRVIGRLIKGLGFKCNCIAEKVIAWIVICQAQHQYVGNQETCWRDFGDRIWINSWDVEKQNKYLDTNFMLLYETELGVKVDRKINKPKENTHKSALAEIKNNIEVGWDIVHYDHDQKIKNLYKDDAMNVGEFYLRELNALFDDKRTRHHMVDCDNPLIRNDLLIRSMKLNKIHPCRWFEPFDRNRIFDFYWNHDDYKRVKIRKRCVVCYKRKSARKGIKLMKCKGCKDRHTRYCSKKCQKRHWKHHKSYCANLYKDLNCIVANQI